MISVQELYELIEEKKEREVENWVNHMMKIIGGDIMSVAGSGRSVIVDEYLPEEKEKAVSLLFTKVRELGYEIEEYENGGFYISW